MAYTTLFRSVLSVGIVRVHTATIEVHLVRVGRAVLRRRPIVSVRTGIVQRTVRVVAVPDSGKLHIAEDKTSRLLQKATRDITNRTAILSTKRMSPSSLLNLRGTLGQLSVKAYRPTLAATLICFKVVNSRRTQRTLKPFRLLLLLLGFTLLLLKFMLYALVELFCVDDQ